VPHSTPTSPQRWRSANETTKVVSQDSEPHEKGQIQTPIASESRQIYKYSNVRSESFYCAFSAEGISTKAGNGGMEGANQRAGPTSSTV
jgi:hypothetical protein